MCRMSRKLNCKSWWKSRLRSVRDLSSAESFMRSHVIRRSHCVTIRGARRPIWLAYETNERECWRRQVACRCCSGYLYISGPALPITHPLLLLVSIANYPLDRRPGGVETAAADNHILRIIVCMCWRVQSYRWKCSVYLRADSATDRDQLIIALRRTASVVSDWPGDWLGVWWNVRRIIQGL